MTLTARKIDRPTTANRMHSVDALRADVAADAPYRHQSLANQDTMDRRYFAARDAGALGMSCMHRFEDVMTIAVDAIGQNMPDGVEHLRQAFALLYLGTEVLHRERVALNIAVDAPDDTLMRRLWLHGLAAAAGADDIADRQAICITDTFTATPEPDILELSADTPFRLFYTCLLDAQRRRVWPSTIPRAEMRAYGDLLATVRDAAAFKAALIDFCDYRVAQALGFDGMAATRRRPESHTGSVLDVGGWITVFPLELFSLQYVFRRLTGNTLDLSAEHPLLRTPLLQPLSLMPLYEDDFMRRVKSLAHETFGAARGSSG